MVQRVDEFRAELQVDSLFQARILQSGQIHHADSRPANTGEAAGKNPHVVRPLVGGVGIECTGVEPLIDAALVARQQNLIERSKQNGIAEAHGIAHLPLIDPLHLPAADDAAGNALRGRSEFAPSSERQFVDAAGDEVKRVILVGDYL